MVAITDSIEIGATPEHVFDWLTNLKTREGYQAWHPDHSDWFWIRGEPFQQGSVIYCEEYLHGELHKLKFVCTRIVPGRLIEYRPLFPWSIVMLGSSFAIDSKGADASVLSASIRFRSFPFIEKILKGRLEAIGLHMKEEGENLKRILEGQSIALLEEPSCWRDCG